MAAQRLTWGGFGLRWLAAFVVVLLTYNPTGYSYVDWLMGEDGNMPLKALGGLVLVIAYLIFLRATFRSIGPLGVVLVVAVFGVAIWSLSYYDILTLSGTTAWTWVGIVVLASILAVGMSWSHVRRRLSGQVDTDDVDE